MNDYRRNQTRARCYRDPYRLLQIIGGVLVIGAAFVNEMYSVKKEVLQK